MIDKNIQETRLRTAIKMAGDRYDTAVNLRVENILNNLYAINREDAFIAPALTLAYKLKRESRYLESPTTPHERLNEANTLVNDIGRLCDRIIAIKSKTRSQKVRWTTLLSTISTLSDKSYALHDFFQEEKEKKEYDQETQSRLGSYSSHAWELFRDLRSLEDQLSRTKQSDLFNTPRMLMRGEAGIGKTHLLCDYAKERLANESPTLIFLGHELSAVSTSKSPLTRMATLMGISSANVFISQLKQLTQSSSSRVCIIIDAVNEADQVQWSELSKLFDIEGISLVISLRSGYDHLVKNKSAYTIVEHTGFSEIAWQAIPKFFEYYKIKIPEIPIIDPEFRNPLFLTIFCKAYSKEGKTPRGHGATHVFEHYIENQSRKILKDLGIKKPDDYLWKNVIKAVGIWMGKNNTDRILRAKLIEIVNSDPILSPKATELIQLLERDGLLLKYPHYSSSRKRSGYHYKFTYHRFSDHLIVRSVLTENGIYGDNASDKARDYLANKPFFKHAMESYNSGLVEALAIQIPERCNGDELVWLIDPKYLGHYLIDDAFIEGLKWRDVVTKGKAKSLAFVNNDQASRYANEYLTGSDNDVYKIINCILDVCAIPNHPFNALRLHKILSRNPMPKRDSWWQNFLVNGLEEGSALDRIYSWSGSDLVDLASSESVKLAAIALIWTMSSTNNTIRDRSTRATISLLMHHQEVIPEILDIFFKNDDPYIQERLFAVIYGCFAINPNDQAIFRDVVDYICENHFKNKSRRPDALMDDYGRTLIELYERLYHKVPWTRRKIIRPPYGYKFPERIHTADWLKKRYRGEDSEYYSIWGSLMYDQGALADFGNYTMGYTIGQFSDTKITEKIKKNHERERYEKFRDRLNIKQSQLLTNYQTLSFRPFALFDADTLKAISKGVDVEPETQEQLKASADDHEKKLAEALKKFKKSLGPIRYLQFLRYEKYITNKVSFPKSTKRRRNQDIGRHNLNIARRWIFWRVVKLGWQPELHKDYDRYTAREGINRIETSRTERIGKKYQWIGLFEYVALAGSNFYLDDDYGSRDVKRRIYQGAYHANLRDFDPTINPRWLAKRQSMDLAPNGWWIPKYDSWNTPNWLHSSVDIPKAADLVDITHKGTDLLSLHCWVTWKGENDPPEDKDNSNYPEMWMHINGYIIKKRELSTALKWCEDKEFWNSLLPEPNDQSNGVFLKEFEGSTAYKQEFEPYRTDWLKKEKDRPFDLLMPMQAYSSSSVEKDGSIKDHFTVFLPNPHLAKILDLEPGKKIGEFQSKDGRLQMFDPSADEEPGRETLLTTKDAFLEKLEANGLTILWTVLGEKWWMKSRGMDEYRGQRLEIHGFAYMNDGKIIENTRYKNDQT